MNTFCIHDYKNNEFRYRFIYDSRNIIDVNSLKVSVVSNKFLYRTYLWFLKNFWKNDQSILSKIRANKQ